MNKIILATIIAISLIAGILIFRPKDQNLYIPKDGMIIFERKGGYLFSNDSGNLFWYKKIENKFYQLNQ